MTLIDELDEGPEKAELKKLQDELIDIYEGLSKTQDVTSTVM